MSFPCVTIVILNYNGHIDTKKCLRSLLKTSYPNFKIIVADNGSKIDEAKILATALNDKRIKYVRFAKNLGFSAGNNRIIQTLDDKYIALLNNDTEVPKSWLSPLIETLEKNKSIAVIQPKILWLKNKKYFDYAGACGGFIDFLGYPFTRGRIFDTRERDKGQYNSLEEIFWASGAAMVVKTNIFKQVGFFDERFFNYMEEIDLCFRIHKAGYKIFCQPASTVYHKVASTASHNMLQKRYWEHRNNLFLILKNYPFWQLLFILPIRLFLEYVSFFYYLYKKQLHFSIAVIKSQISLLPIILSLILKRDHIIGSAGDSMKKLIYPKSIVLDYFILKKRRFYELKQTNNRISPV